MSLPLSLLVLLLITTCVNSKPRRTGVLAPEGAWCWFQDPRAIQEGSTTYTGFVDGDGNIIVTSLNHKTGKFLSTIVNQEFYEKNDHNNPSLLISKNDKLVFVFWSQHSGPHMLFRRSIRPLDISEWGPIRKVMTNSLGTKGYTYPNPVQLPREGPNIYLFWRGGSYQPTWSIMSYSNFNWKPAKTLIKVPSGSRPYVKVRGNGKNTIHFAFTEAHPRNLITSIYHMYYKGDLLYRTNGKIIGRMDDGAEPHEATRIYDATKTKIRAWIHDLAIEPKTGYPVVTFATIFNSSYHRYHYARWNGRKWKDTDLIEAGGTISEDLNEPHYSGGITLDPEDPRIIHMSRDVLGQGIFEIERWTRQDLPEKSLKSPSIDQLYSVVNGYKESELPKVVPENWTPWKIESITVDSEEINVRPYSPVGSRCARCPMSVLWMSGKYPSYTRFETKIKYTM